MCWLQLGCCQNTSKSESEKDRGIKPCLYLNWHHALVPLQQQQCCSSPHLSPSYAKHDGWAYKAFWTVAVSLVLFLVSVVDRLLRKAKL